MKECQPVPCPEPTETSVHVTGFCNCAQAEYNRQMLPGSPDCPVHGQWVKGYVFGWNAASDAFDAAVRQQAHL